MFRVRSAAYLAVALVVPAAAVAHPAGMSPGGPADDTAGIAVVGGPPATTTDVPEPPAPSGLACPCAPECWANPFAAGSTSTQILVGAYHSIPLGPRIPAFNYVPVSIRQGWMLTDPEDYGWGLTNFECVLDFTAAAITSNYGNWFFGPSFLLRSNWLELGPTVVPYTQLGVGGVYNDAYRDQTQEAIGGYFEFYLHAEAGLRWFIAPNLSLDLEGGLQHISNGGTFRRNLGVNALGAAVGLTYYFPVGGR